MQRVKTMDSFILRTEHDRAELIQYIKSTKLDPFKPKTVTFKGHRRSLKQNGLYWAWINDIVDFWTHKTSIPGPIIWAQDQAGKVHVVGYEKENVHKWFARRLLPAEKIIYNYPDGDVKYDMRIKSTSDEDPKPFSEYMMKVRLIMMDVWDLVLETPEGNAFTQYLNSLESA